MLTYPICGIIVFRPLRDKYQEVAKSMFMESSTAQTPGGGGANKRKKQAELEEKINALYSNIKLFEKSVKVINGMWLYGFVYLVDLHFAENDFVW